VGVKMETNNIMNKFNLSTNRLHLCRPTFGIDSQATDQSPANGLRNQGKFTSHIVFAVQ